MIRVQKFKFEHCYETFQTENVHAAVKSLLNYRCCGNNLFISTKFVGEYAIVDLLDINGNPVNNI